MSRPSGRLTKSLTPVPEEFLNSSEQRTYVAPKWPDLGRDALHGLAGEIVEEVDPHSEADKVAVLLSLLASFGNASGRGTWFRVGAGKHHLKLNVVLVGETSKGRKGSSWDYIEDLMRLADRTWLESRVEGGLSSGEGLINAVRDTVYSENRDGEIEVKEPGVTDKRLFVKEGEFASILKVATREGNTLSAIIRSAWDSGKLSTLTKNSPLKATDSHISILGHITQQEITRMLSDTDAHNGFANRFLWAAVRRSKKLPFGGDWQEVNTEGISGRLHEALRFARDCGEMIWGPSARPLWVEAYDHLSEGDPGLLGAVTSRSEAYVLRLACVYAALDRSQTIDEPHLKAALALWDYCEASARYIFGNQTGDPIADRIEDDLRDANPRGMTRSEIREIFSRNQSSERIGQALETLQRFGRARAKKDASGQGRPVEKWYSV